MQNIKYVAISDLIPYAKNARTHSDAQIAQVAASIKEFGFINPVITDGQNGIIAGHCRVLAAFKIGLETVPCLEASHLTDAQKKAFILADNQLALNADWDFKVLELELNELAALDFDIGLVGFDDDLLEGFFVEHTHVNVDSADEFADDDPKAEWGGMPEFLNEDKSAPFSIKVNFYSKEAIRRFSELVGQTITDRTKYINYPHILNDKIKEFGYV